jgi:hypothetical protein
LTTPPTPGAKPLVVPPARGTAVANAKVRTSP